jgi:superfamily II DNA or RNA helicase
MTTEGVALAFTLVVSGLIMGIVARSEEDTGPVSGGGGGSKRLLRELQTSDRFVTVDDGSKRARRTPAGPYRDPQAMGRDPRAMGSSVFIPESYSEMAAALELAANDMAKGDLGAKCRASCRTKPQLMEAQEQANADIESGERPRPVAPANKRKPKPHQTFVADALAIPEMTGLVVVHGLGSGKTITGITAALNILALGISEKILIIAPAMLIAQWRDEISKYIGMQDIEPPPKIKEAIDTDMNMASRIYIVSYNAFGNKYRKIILGEPVHFESIATAAECDPYDEEATSMPKASYADGISQLEKTLQLDPVGAEQRLQNAFAGFSLIVDEAHRLVRGFARLNKTLKSKLADRGVERDGELELTLVSPESMSPESLESLDAEGVRTKKINNKLSFIQAIVDCLPLFKKRVLMTATPAPNEPEDFGRMSALARAFSVAPNLEPFTTVRSVKNDDQKPVTQVIMHKEAVSRNVGSLISYYPSTALPGEATAFPKLNAAWVYVPMSKAHTNNYLIATGERDDPNDVIDLEQLTVKQEMQRRMLKQIAKRMLGIWNKNTFAAEKGNVDPSFVRLHFPKMAEVMQRVRHLTFGAKPGPVIIYVEYESCIDDIVRCIKAYCPGAYDMNQHIGTNRPPLKDLKKIQEKSLLIRNQCAPNKRDEPGKNLRFCTLTSKTKHSHRVMIQSLFTRVDNAEGDLVRILIMTSAGCEGLDLKWVKQVHILAPPWTASRVQQVVGRAVRFCSHPAGADGRDVTDSVDAYFYTSMLPRDDDERSSMNFAHREQVETLVVRPYVRNLMKKLAELDTRLPEEAVEKIEKELVSVVAGNPMQTCANLRRDIEKSVTDTFDTLNNVNDSMLKDAVKNINKLIKTDIRSSMTSRERLKADAAYLDSDHTAEQETWTKLIQEWYKLNAVQMYVATLSIDCPLHHGRSGLKIGDCAASHVLDVGIQNKLTAVSSQCLAAHGGGECYQMLPNDEVVDQSARFLGMPGILEADAAYERYYDTEGPADAENEYEDMELDAQSEGYMEPMNEESGNEESEEHMEPMNEEREAPEKDYVDSLHVLEIRYDDNVVVYVRTDEDPLIPEPKEAQNRWNKNNQPRFTT